MWEGGVQGWRGEGIEEGGGSAGGGYVGRADVR